MGLTPESIVATPTPVPLTPSCPPTQRAPIEVAVRCIVSRTARSRLSAVDLRLARQPVERRIRNVRDLGAERGEEPPDSPADSGDERRRGEPVDGADDDARGGGVPRGGGDGVGADAQRSIELAVAGVLLRESSRRADAGRQQDTHH